jgi:AraC-like DNA-binding protein
MHRLEKGEGFPDQRIVVLPPSVIARAVARPLLRALLPTDAGYFPNAAGHFRQRKKGVDQAIFIYCAQGRGWCRIEGRRHEVSPGDLLVVPPETPHAYGADEKQPWTIHWVHATGNTAGLLLDELGVRAEAPVAQLGRFPELLSLFDELLQVLEHGYTPTHLLYAAQTLTHLIGAMIWHQRQTGREGREPTRKILHSVEYMKHHLEKTLSVAALAAMANFSASHFTALFKQHTGYAPIDYFIRLRMHHACQLLDTTSLSVKEISTMVGYDDPFYFSRMFKSLNEIAPSDYRLLHKG